MLRHMYLLPYSQPKAKAGSDVFKFHIDIFMLADKYDCPSLRNAAVAEFHRSADAFHAHWQIQNTLDHLTSAIAELCGPDASHFQCKPARYSALYFIFLQDKLQKLYLGYVSFCALYRVLDVETTTFY
jgi:hypothetical protein